jgi:hypothetical protein
MKEKNRAAASAAVVDRLRGELAERGYHRDFLMMNRRAG